MNNLDKYNQKRDFTKTKEPKGNVLNSKGKLHFCIQHHLARKDHYDFRLEWDGVLLSWAVPKGLSLNPKEKRLAIMVENHPLAYRRFEGVIPRGQYGAGVVMLVDDGYYEMIEYKPNLIKFKLMGKRIKGKWSLVNIKENNWLIIKEDDDYVLKDNIKNYKRSVKTNRTMEEIEKNVSLRKTSRKEAIVAGIKITNPNKVIFTHPKITKLNIAMYYHKVAKKMLPLIQNRIISTIRAPEGIEKETFFMKHFNNPYLGKIKVKSEHGKREDYYYIKDEQGLIYEVQMNSYEFHIWGSKVDSLNNPDMLVFDLDPDVGLSLKKVKEGVKDLKKILEELKLKAKLKTSGGKGYHIIVYLKEKVSWDKFREIALNIAQIMEKKYPDKYTSNIRIDRRDGKIFVDWLRNTKKATSVAPYSLRLTDKAPISYPITFKALEKVNPKSYTLKSISKK